MTVPIWRKALREPQGSKLAAAIMAYGAVAALVVTTVPLVLSRVEHLDKSHVAAYFVLYSLAGTLLNLLAGHLSDRRAPRYLVATIAAVTSTTGYVVLSSSTRILTVYVAALFASTALVLFSQLFAVAKSHLLASWPAEEQTVGMTVLRTVFTLGYVIGTLLASLLDGLLALRTVSLLVAGSFLLIAGFAAYAIYSTERHCVASHTREPQTRLSITAGRSAVSFAVLSAPLFALLLLQGADATRNVYLPLVEFHLFRSVHVAPLMFAISAAVELVATTAVGYLAARIGEANVISLGALVGAVYFFLLSLVIDLPFLYASNVFYSVFIAALMGVAMSYVFRLLPNRAGMSGALYVATLSGGSLFGGNSKLK